MRLRQVFRNALALLSAAEKNRFDNGQNLVSEDDRNGAIRFIQALTTSGILAVIRIPQWYESDPAMRKWLSIYQRIDQKKEQPLRALESAVEGVVESAAAAAQTSLRPYIVASAWVHAIADVLPLRPDFATLGDSVTLSVSTKNIDDGTYVHFDVYEGDPKNAQIVKTIDALVQSNSAQCIYDLAQDNPPSTVLKIRIDDSANTHDTCVISDDAGNILSEASCGSAQTDENGRVLTVENVPLGKPVIVSMRCESDTTPIISKCVVGKMVPPILPLVTFVVRCEELTSGRRSVPLKTPHEAARIAAEKQVAANASESSGAPGDLGGTSSAASSAHAKSIASCAWTFADGENRALAAGDGLMLSCKANNFSDGDAVLFDIVDAKNPSAPIASLSGTVAAGYAKVPWVFGNSSQQQNVRLVFSDPIVGDQQSQDSFTILCADGTTSVALSLGDAKPSESGMSLDIACGTALPSQLQVSIGTLGNLVIGSLDTASTGESLRFTICASAEACTMVQCQVVAGSAGTVYKEPSAASTTTSSSQNSDSSSSSTASEANPPPKEAVAAAEVASLLAVGGIVASAALIEALKKNTGRGVLVTSLAGGDGAGDHLSVKALGYTKKITLSDAKPLVYTDIPKSGLITLEVLDRDGFTYSIPLKAKA